MMGWSENIDEFQWEKIGSLEAKMFKGTLGLFGVKEKTDYQDEGQL